MAGAADNILKTLEHFGLTWDGEVDYQSRRLSHYQAILARLKQKRLLYPCACSRKTLAHSKRDPNNPRRYPGHCRGKIFSESTPSATRLKVENGTVEFFDVLHGQLAANLAQRHGDFIIKRKDRIFAYQFAVVIDDHEQSVNHIVRGADLLDSTFSQIYLQQQLQWHCPVYMHVPLVIDRNGHKLSKQTFARAVDQNNPRQVLFKLLGLLRQAPPVELADGTVAEILDWGVNHWNLAALIALKTVNPSSDPHYQLIAD